MDENDKILSMKPLGDSSKITSPKSISRNANNQQNKGAKSKVTELNLAGYFVWDPEINDTKEIELLAAGKWHPATVDFLAVMGSNTNTGMGDFNAILGEIAQAGPRKIKRVNFMTHSNNTMLGIRGRNDSNDVLFDVMVTVQDINNLKQSGLIIKYNSKDFTLQDVRDAFVEDAIFVLYGCKAGQNLALLTALHDLLGVKVVGFKERIAFCPPPASGGKFVRKGMRTGVDKPGFACSTDSVTDWRGLITHRDAISVP